MTDIQIYLQLLLQSLKINNYAVPQMFYFL